MAAAAIASADCEVPDEMTGIWVAAGMETPYLVILSDDCTYQVVAGDTLHANGRWYYVGQPRSPYFFLILDSRIHELRWLDARTVCLPVTGPRDDDDDAPPFCLLRLVKLERDGFQLRFRLNF